MIDHWIYGQSICRHCQRVQVWGKLTADPADAYSGKQINLYVRNPMLHPPERVEDQGPLRLQWFLS